MFNMLSEHLFASQSLLKEWRRPPTGGLREACKEACIAPIGAFPVGASFLIEVETTKELVLIGSKTL